MLRVAWFTAWSYKIPLRSGVVSGACVRALSQPNALEQACWEIETFVGDADLEELTQAAVHAVEQPFGVGLTFHYLRAWERHQLKPFDLFIYSVEDHPRCRFIAEYHHTMPGIVITHDINLNRLCWDRFAHTTAPTEINDEMDVLFGRHSARLGDAFVRGWPLDAFDRVYRRGLAQLNRAHRLVLGSAVHSRSLSSGLKARSRVLPIPLDCFSPPVDPLSAVRPSSYLVLDVSPSDTARARGALIAAQRLWERSVPIPLVWIVSHEEDIPHAEQLLNSSAKSCPALLERISIRSPLTLHARAQLIGGAALVISPGGDEFRGTSFVVATALASGRPVILPNIGIGEDLPSDLAIKLEPEHLGARRVADSIMTAAAMAALIADFESAERIGSNAKTWVSTDRSVAKFCVAFRALVHAELPSLSTQRRITERRYLAAQALHVHSLMERFDDQDLWGSHQQATDDGLDSPQLFDRILRPALRDFGWLDAISNERAQFDRAVG